MVQGILILGDYMKKIISLLVASSFAFSCGNKKEDPAKPSPDSVTPNAQAPTTQPLIPSVVVFGDKEKMNIDALKQAAFALCQHPFKKPVIEPVPILDPPQISGTTTEGMIYQEELAVRTSNLLDKDGFYFSPRPRAAVNSIPMDIFVLSDNSQEYQRKTWENANPDYSDITIQPAINKDMIPAAGRVLTELIIGHQSPKGDYPQLFDIRSSAYVRFAGYPPQITGASLRLAAHKIFSQGANKDSPVQEDFPIVRAMFASVKTPHTANALLLVESELFCGAFDMDMTEGDHAEIVVDSYWYTREDFDWKKDPHTGFVAYSSMLFQTEKGTPNVSTDEAHDSDMLTVKYANNTEERYPLAPPASGLQIRDLTVQSEQQQPVEWILANEDLDPSHYADFAANLKDTNYNFRASYSVAILYSDIKTGVSLYEHSADGEYGDNIVAVSTIRQDIKKATSADQAIQFKYKTTAFYPNKSN